LLFEILKKALPHSNLKKIISKFKEKYEIIQGSFEFIPSPSYSDEQGVKKWNFPFNIKALEAIPKPWKWYGLLGFILLSAISIGFVLFYERQIEPSIRSDLIIPAESFFLERPKLLAEIDEKFKGQKGIQTIALVGIGGAGKTTLARQYAHAQRGSVLWEINAETKESLKRSFENLAENLSKTEKDQKILRGIQEIKDPAEKEVKIIQFVKERLKSCPRWLLIYDNIEKFADIQKSFPNDTNTWGEGKIILTTRDSNFQNTKYINQTIPIEELNVQEKLNIFSKIMNNGNKIQLTSGQKEEAEQFLTKIPPFPLDVSIAAYHIKSTGLSYEKYLKHLNEHASEFEQINQTILKETSNYTKTRYNIITLSLKQLIEIHKDFSDLLLFISLLDSQNIPRQLLEAYKSEVIVDNFIYHLKKYSLITIKNSISSPSLMTLSIHRSTQEISLNYFIKTLDLKTNHQLLQSVSNTLEKYIASTIDDEDLSIMKGLIHHCEKFLNHDSLLTTEMMEPIGGELGIIHYYIGNYIQAKYFLEKSFSKLNKSNKENPTRIAWILGYLGNVYRDLGDYEKARNLIEKSAQLYMKHLPENHPKIAWILVYLGICDRYLGNYEKAKKSFEQSLEAYKKHLPEYYVWFAWPLGQLGIINREIGNYEKARSLLEESLRIFKKYRPKEHIDIAWAFEHLGVVYNELGNYEKARKSFEQSLEIYKKYCSEDDIYIAWVLSHLGDTFTRLKDYKKAKDLLEKSYSIYEKHYGKNHIEIARVLEKLGQVYFAEGQMETAENFIRKAFNILQKNKHPETYISLESLAELYLKKSIDASNKGNIKQSQNLETQSLDYLKQALGIVKTSFPKDSPHLIRIQSKLKNIR